MNVYMHEHPFLAFASLCVICATVAFSAHKPSQAIVQGLRFLRLR